ncbi:hypothetical protein BB559_002201 [Furculomyces boomerangus]|uniref:Splicing factor YJU2 n=2 Tax=Harpellales TaxID=61421 RepID=A0A2T9YX53_9FUNG|nr:hypothetical protein BB559_002201 [Furculomyces boomerangus]PVZ99563.1 hypothetical protein BB558_004443 [Smittium angustum]
MSERKVLNKYFPPDFDPSLIPRMRLGKDRQYKVRLMAPFSMRCSTCGHWIGIHTKFNARKETVKNEKFHNMEIFRFYIRCPRCAAEITFKTDPENLGYVCALRNFEPWRGENDINEQIQREKEEEEAENPIKALENRTEESKREIEVLDALDEIRTRNSVQERVGLDQAIQTIVDQKEKAIDEMMKKVADEEDEIIRTIFKDADGERVKRINTEIQEDLLKKQKISFHNDPLALSNSKKLKSNQDNVLSKLGIIVKKPTKPHTEDKNIKSKPQEIKNTQTSVPNKVETLDSLLGDYDSSSSSE